MEYCKNLLKTKIENKYGQICIQMHKDCIGCDEMYACMRLIEASFRLDTLVNVVKEELDSRDQKTVH